MAMKAAWIRGASRVEAVELIRQMTGGYGADVCVDAVGMEADRSLVEKALGVVRAEVGTMKTLGYCLDAVRRGGVVTVVGVYGTPFDNFPLHQWFDKGIQMKGGQLTVHKYLDHLISLVQQEKMQIKYFIEALDSYQEEMGTNQSPPNDSYFTGLNSARWMENSLDGRFTGSASSFIFEFRM
ncbi:hypothetical protein [Dyadobacter arcticus]|uniref:Threonine dehydrogenase-like Zn-dependent dehydrogenase n=1 Tax=Dyadobacter arcticus TaxID=1078754 RepID=A0ABX0UPL4_9BACT|nr:hypothetical protein [Dyadobacter arcticus]NIJ52971.1 threonine dehydrogenase-like Zn-dependent dehydrogenase [Dyadobacter arcticus]